MPFIFEKQEIEDVILVTPHVFEDSRGCFVETYKESDFKKNGITEDFVQDNYSVSYKNVLRGLHYQAKPYAQAKIVRCVSGRIMDVIADVRPNSKTFKKYLTFELTGENNKMLYIPKGFAHGFITLSEKAVILYKNSTEYHPESDRGIIWNDNELGIDWGIDFEPILSDKDGKQPKLSQINMEELV